VLEIASGNRRACVVVQQRRCRRLHGNRPPRSGALKSIEAWRDTTDLPIYCRRCKIDASARGFGQSRQADAVVAINMVQHRALDHHQGWLQAPRVSDLGWACSSSTARSVSEACTPPRVTQRSTRICKRVDPFPGRHATSMKITFARQPAWDRGGERIAKCLLTTLSLVFRRPLNM